MATLPPKVNLVRGTVTDVNRRPLANLKIEIFNVDMRSWQPLSAAVTNREGFFEMNWSQSQLGDRERKTADIGVKVYSAERGTELFTSNMDQVRFNAGPHEEINIVITTAVPVEMNEFDLLVKEVSVLADKVPLYELEESKKNRDITFLSKEIEVPEEKLEHLVIAHRLQKLSEADADFFYALLRKNTLVGVNAASPLQARQSIGIGDDDQTLLYDAALTDPKKIEAAVNAAATEKTVSNAVVKNLQRNLHILAGYRQKAEVYYSEEHPQKVVALLLNMMNPVKLVEVKQLFEENKNDLNSFLEKISDPDFINPKKKILDGKLNDGIQKLYDLARTAVPAIVKGNKIKKEEDLRKLARFNKDKWVEEIEKVKPALKDSAVINTYASAIVRRFEKEFPTTAFTAQLERSTETVLTNQKEVVSFLNNHEDFDLTKTNVDLFLKEKKLAPKEAELVSNELKSVQRVFNLVPNYSKTMALRSEKIHSAFNIVSIGEARFTKEIAPKAGLSATEATEVFQKAATKHTAAMLLIGELNDSMSGMQIASLKNLALIEKIEAVSKDFPNLKSLFKLTDICECEHCRSVYSPAAYLVEILQFLDKRTVVAGNAKSVLFNRRPDLGEIDLGCENANTPVKYVDLVCEILEEAIAPDAGINYTGALTTGSDPSKGKISPALLAALSAAGLPVTANALIHETEANLGSPASLPHYLRDSKLVCKIVNTGGNNYQVFRLRQTMSSAAELDAAPEYVNTAAYNTLRTKNTAFKLPFDLPHTEATAYFERFGLNRDHLMKLFQLAAGPTEEAIAAETLRLTDNERTIIANTPAPNDNAAQQAFWNVPAPGVVISYLNKVDNFLTRTGLAYKELELLLKLRCINVNSDLFVYNNDLTCNTATKEIKNLDLNVLDRMHRFLRLQKKLGWKPETLDEAISQNKLGNGSINDATLKVLANLKRLIDNTGLKPEELICCYGELPHKLLPYQKTTLYDQLFQNKAKSGSIEPALSAENVAANEAALVKKQLAEFKAAICTCTNIREIDFDKLVTALPNGDLSFANLSALYALGKFIKKFKLKTEDFFLLKALTGIDPLNTTADTLAFYKAATTLPPMKLSDVQFMTAHLADNLSDRIMKLEKIDTLIKGLQAAYQKSFNANRSLYKNDQEAEAQKETLKSKLATLNVLTEADVAILLNFVDCNWKYAWTDDKYVVHTNADPNNPNVADAITFMNEGHINGKKISDLIDITQIIAKLNLLQTPHDNLAAAETALITAQDTNTGVPAAQAAYDAAKTAYNNAQKALIKAWLDAISIFQFKAEKYSLLISTIETTFQAPTDTVETILANAILKKMAPGTDKLLDVLLSDSLIDTADITPLHPLPVLPTVNEAAFPKQYGAIRLLHKLIPLVKSFNIDTVQLKWLLNNNNALGWFELDNIPFAAAQPAEPYSAFTDLVSLLNIARELTPVANPKDAEKPITFLSIIDLVLTPATTRDELMTAIALLTGYEKTDLIDLDTYFFPAFSLGNYKSITNLKRLFTCADSMRQLSANVTQITQYLAPVLTAPVVANLRANLKTRYDEDTWLSTLKEIMDKIRPQKRNALVNYILATNDGIKDENDLYEYFLVDVEMGSCMPSSRIVLAHNSVQLFVQRCLMGLEPNAIADVDHDPNWNQWKWMKNYRVWEANRKIFLFPENWYDVTLADDKSFLLTEFINELQQNELTNDTAEEALRKYLEKLDNIAFLEVKATWYDVPTRTMHVFARTKGGDPAIYYYRRFEKEKYWTAWEKVELDIPGDHLLAFMRNNRLNLAWPLFSEETDPNQGSKLPDQGNPNEQAVDKPRKKLKAQLAISEFSNKKWQPKKVSKDAIMLPPGGYLTAEISREMFQFFYNELSQQILLYRVPEGRSYWNSSKGAYDPETVLYWDQVAGAFNIAGCKGYPEVAQVSPYNLNFLPIFTDTKLLSQHYKELAVNPGNDLSVINVHSLFTGQWPDEILKSTPGLFRLSYPHQFTVIDQIAFLFEWFLFALQRNVSRDKRFTPILPMGTLLPYFMEDSWHAYVVIPGFYYPEFAGGEFPSLTGLNDDDKRTASDVFQLIDDFVNWVKKMLLEFQTNPPGDLPTAIKIIVADAGFQDLIQESAKYKALHPFLNLLFGISDDKDFEAQLKALLEKGGLIYGEQFKNMYHPLVCSLRTILYKDGIPGLMKRDTQLKINTAFNFKTNYNPRQQFVPKLSYKQHNGTVLRDYPIEDIDFTSEGSYSLYNWDLFFRVPLHIAESLTKNQRFEEALTWFHYMFNPTGALPGTGVQKYWVTKPFFLNQQNDYEAQRIDSLMYATAKKTGPHIKDLEFAIDEWRTKPFRPDVVARNRPVAYQKAVLMKYIDNLTEWGDYLFRQDTMESIAQATQLYILADKLLGPKPKLVPPVVKPPYETYNQIEAKLDSFGNALIALENILPDLTVLPEGGKELPPPPVTLSMLYFCIPHNEKMFAYWDRVADRLFKIRHCQNIDGIERSLALFAPPIDPGMLVKAAASGLDISAVLAGLNAPIPFYRFSTLSQKATELAEEVRTLGNSLLQTLEKKDTEGLSLLRNELELKVLNAVKDIKKLQIKEAIEQVENLKRTQAVVEERKKYYSTIQKIIAKEQLSMTLLESAQKEQASAQNLNILASVLGYLPNITIGASGFGGSPHVNVQWGTGNIISALQAVAGSHNLAASMMTYQANNASTLGGYDRRFDDWKLQQRIAEKELLSIEKQIKAAEFRREISETDLENHELQIENAKKTDEYMRSKFTNKELYDWLIGQTSAVYFRSYQLAHDFAKKAERCYRFELGNDDSFISYGYWDSMKKGLQSADKLIHDIKRMESGYLDKHKREYEITKHVSLAQLDPLALIKLRNTGVCDFEIPEALYDLDYAGHYFRRIKSVSISLPCIAGPYTSVSAKLSLINNKYRKNTDPDNVATTGYLEDTGNDERFVYNIGAIQSVATGAQNDSGLFDLNFRDDRYLPFEGCGAISSWRLELPTPTVAKQFNYDTIADVILHVKYTAREGGSSLKGLAEGQLTTMLAAIRQQIKSDPGIHLALNMKQELPNEWHLLKKNKTAALTIARDRLPYFIKAMGGATINHITFFAKAPNVVNVQINGTPLPINGTMWGLRKANSPTGAVSLDTAFNLAINNSTELDTLEDLVMVVKIDL